MLSQSTNCQSSAEETGSQRRPWPPLSEHQRGILQRYQEAANRLDEGLIRPEMSAKKPERSLAKWQARLAEMRSFLAACGNPQHSFKAVHVTGTSGKGSVATLVAHALRAAGYRVGLHTSPFLQSPVEKNWIDGSLLAPETFADLVDWVWPVALPRRTAETPASIHGMASVVLALEAFRRAQVDVAVIEAGCGGRFDLTNCLDTAVAVVTTVGYDHVLSLGPTLEDIAWHKAGIFQANTPAVTGAQGPGLPVLRQEAERQNVPLREITPPDGPFWEFNGDMARAACEQLAPRFSVPSWAMEQALGEARLPARREVMPEPRRLVILDGAHNAEKMTALTKTLPPDCLLVVGCLTAKDLPGLVQALRPAAARVVATQPEVYAKPACPAAEVARTCQAAGIAAEAIPDPHAALERAIEISGAAQPVVATGSLYLVGQLRTAWYPTEHVVLQQTSWPRP